MCLTLCSAAVGIFYFGISTAAHAKEKCPRKKNE